MERILSLLQIDYPLLSIGTYHLSLIEVLVVLFSLMGTFASRLGWILTLLANLCFFLFFHQTQLYALMAAQVILFVLHLIWGIRSDPAKSGAIKKLDSSGLILSFIATFMPGISLVIALVEVPKYFPEWFPLPATFAMLDALLAIGSIVATVLLARRFIETWVFWMIIHSLLIIIFGWKGFYLAMVGQMVLLGYATKEYLTWRNLLSSQTPPKKN